MHWGLCQITPYQTIQHLNTPHNTIPITNHSLQNVPHQWCDTIPNHTILDPTIPWYSVDYHSHGHHRQIEDEVWKVGWGECLGHEHQLEINQRCFHLCNTVHAMLFTCIVHIIEHIVICILNTTVQCFSKIEHSEIFPFDNLRCSLPHTTPSHVSICICVMSCVEFWNQSRGLIGQPAR